MQGLKIKNNFFYYKKDRKKSYLKLVLVVLIYYILNNYLLNFLDSIFPVLNKISSNESTGTLKELTIPKLTIILLFASLLEELKYRLVFTKANFKYLIFSIALLVTDLLFTLLRPSSLNLFGEKYLVILLYFVSLFLVAIGIFKILTTILLDKKEFIEEFIYNSYVKLFIIQAVLFAFWHIYFSGQIEKHHIITLAMVHFIGALFFGMIRIYYGIITSVLVHFILNFLSYILYFIFI
ncbi:membrane hypothetical protein [Tenacibaculum litoreum]|uniref:hypothetical protein n=1 Tax=Tenacibaculum litoreum TaxID=321269 RepID=UPI0038935A58